jgi:hypothetical protein
LSLLSKNDKPWFLNWGKTSCYTHHTFLLDFPMGWSFTTHKDHHRLEVACKLPREIFLAANSFLFQFAQPWPCCAGEV